MNLVTAAAAAAVAGKTSDDVKLETVAAASSVMLGDDLASTLEAAKAEQIIHVAEQTESDLFPGALDMELEQFSKSSQIAVLEYESVFINQLE